MYTLKITDENTVVTTVKEKLIEKSNFVDKIQIVVAKLYREQIDMSDAEMYMKYVLPISKKIKMIKLTPNDLAYENDYIQYLIPAEAYLTAEAGDIEVSFTFLKLTSNEDDSTTSYVRKTQSGVIHISPLATFDGYEPDGMLSEVDQRLLKIISLQEDLKVLNETTYNEMIRDIHINNDNKVILVDKDGNDSGNGIDSAALSSIITKDIVGTDPDGTDDGITDLDQVPEIKDLDTLLN